MSFRAKTSETLFAALESMTERLLDAIDKIEFQVAKELVEKIREFIYQNKNLIPEREKGFLDDLFVLRRYADLAEAHFKTWKSIINGEFTLSWISLQDGLDAIRHIKKFSHLQPPLYEQQLLGLEKIYPYTFFASVGLMVDCYICNICGFDIDSFECPHVVDELYNGTLAQGIPNNVTGMDHVSIVENPKDKRCVVEYEDNSEHFSLLQYLSNALRAEKFRISSFRDVEISKRKVFNPDYVSLGRNEKCYCGSGIKFKKCCIAERELVIDHFDLIFSDSLKPQGRMEELLKAPESLSVESFTQGSKVSLRIL